MCSQKSSQEFRQAKWGPRKLALYGFIESYTIMSLQHPFALISLHTNRSPTGSIVANLYTNIFFHWQVCAPRVFYTYQQIFATNKLLHQQFLHRECFISLYQHFLHRQVFTPQVFTLTCFYTSELYQIVSPTNSNIYDFTPTAFPPTNF